MNVLQVTSRYPPYTGGVETHVAELATRLAERDHAVTVHTGDRDPLAGMPLGDDGDSPPACERRDGVRVRRHRGVAPGGAFHVAPGVAPAVRRSDRAFREGDADIVHAHNYHSLPALFAALGRPSEVPLVVTPHYHGGSADALRDRLLDVYRPLGGWALDRADRVIAVSEWERDALARDFGVDATVIPNGLDVDRFADATAESRDRPYLLCVGRLEAYKGVQHAVRALADLPGYELLVAGSGPHADDLERVAREAGVADRVEFLGYVDDERLPGLYAGAATHLQLSEFEAYGMTVAEALAAGTPCVVREAGALADWVGRDDCVGVSEVGSGVVASAVREAVGMDAPSEGLPGWDEVVEEVEGVYEGVVGR